jgi:hypothetical protein
MKAILPTLLTALVTAQAYTQTAPDTAPPPDPAPQAEPAQPAQPDIATIAKDKNLWPKEVILNKAIQIPVQSNGKTVGKVVAPSGSTLTLVAVRPPDKLHVTFSGNPMLIPADYTDFAQRVAYILKVRAAQANRVRNISEVHPNDPVVPDKVPRTFTIKTKELVSSSTSVTQKAGVEDTGRIIYHTPEYAIKTQFTTIEISIQNLTPYKGEGFTVKYVVLGRDIETKEIVEDVSDVKVVNFGPTETIKINTKPTTFESDATTYKRGYFRNSNSKTGLKYYGIAVKLIHNNETVKEVYLPNGLQDDMKKWGIDF